MQRPDQIIERNNRQNRKDNIEIDGVKPIVACAITAIRDVYDGQLFMPRLHQYCIRMHPALKLIQPLSDL